MQYVSSGLWCSLSNDILMSIQFESSHMTLMLHIYILSHNFAKEEWWFSTISQGDTYTFTTCFQNFFNAVECSKFCGKWPFTSWINLNIFLKLLIWKFKLHIKFVLLQLCQCFTLCFTHLFLERWYHFDNFIYIYDWHIVHIN